jgi:putative acetyltransferase
MRMEKPFIMDKEKLLIREEKQADIAAIAELTVAAFKTLAISSHTEHFIVDALRAAGALTVSLVAELDDRLVGHLALSPVTIAGATGQWYGLGPISVLPEMQRQGIGKALIEQGLARLRQLGAGGVCLVGHPGYYRRFGFVNVDGLGLTGVPPEVFFALSFDGVMPRGEVAFHPGFQATGR